MNEPALRRRIREWIDEDLGPGDLTTEACVPVEKTAAGLFVTRQAGLIAGLDLIRLVYGELDPQVRWTANVADGEEVPAGAVLGTIAGPARPILTGERLALNLVQRACGIATLTRRFVRAAGGKVAVLDTRKTTPGLRAIEKAAVRAGGGRNHRFGLFDGILIKDNHIVAAGGIAAAVAAARRRAPHGLKIQVEVDSLAQLDEAVAAGAEALLLDNFAPAQLREACRRAPEGIFLEASGGITLETAADVAASGVHAISIGALTHSAPALDIGLDLTLE